MQGFLATHLGRPDGKVKKEFSTKPIVASLSKILGKKVKFIDDCIGDKVAKEIKTMRGGEVLLLENLRFHAEEQKNDQKFARALAMPFSVYVNDAFAVDHRADASVSAIKKFLPSYGGLLLAEEIKNLNKVLKPKSPLVVVMGGSKIGSKLPMLKKFLKIADKILIGGALANNFVSARGFVVGKSLVDPESIALAKKLDCAKIVLPVDFLVKENKKSGAKLKKAGEIKDKDAIYDIGPETIRLFASFIKPAKTLIWNGPMGLFEDKEFRNGTMAVAREVSFTARGRAFAVAGGGETIEALKLAKTINDLDWVSTGGGATLEYLGGEKMPGLAGIGK